MAAKDAVTKEYMRDTKVFADAFNFLLYEGRPVIDPGRLHAMDTAEIVLPYGEDGVTVPIQKYRDNLKYLTAMEDGKAAYLVLGVEAQSEVSYPMPVRDMLYDAMQYAQQGEKAASSHREEARKRSERKRQEASGQSGEASAEVRISSGFSGQPGDPKERVSSGEFLGGFYKRDRLLPVITLVVLFSPEPWDGPMSIHEMLAGVEEELLPFIADYRINLIAPAAMAPESMDRFQSSLREVLLYIKYSRDKGQLRSLLETDPHYRELDMQAATVINTVTHSKLKLEEKEGKVDMCLAIEEMRLESEKTGEQRGEIIGERRGEKKGISRINRLNSILLQQGRLEDLKRATQEPEYQEALIEELLLDGFSF